MVIYFIGLEIAALFPPEHLSFIYVCVFICNIHLLKGKEVVDFILRKYIPDVPFSGSFDARVSGFLKD